jgi:hypothetical protein
VTGRKASGRRQYVTRLSPLLIRQIKARERRAECEVVEALLAPALRAA